MRQIKRTGAQPVKPRRYTMAQQRKLPVAGQCAVDRHNQPVDPPLPQRPAQRHGAGKAECAACGLCHHHVRHRKRGRIGGIRRHGDPELRARRATCRHCAGDGGQTAATGGEISGQMRKFACTSGQYQAIKPRQPLPALAAMHLHHRHDQPPVRRINVQAQRSCHAAAGLLPGQRHGGAIEQRRNRRATGTAAHPVDRSDRDSAPRQTLAIDIAAQIDPRQAAGMQHPVEPRLVQPHLRRGQPVQVKRDPPGKVTLPGLPAQPRLATQRHQAGAVAAVDFSQGQTSADGPAGQRGIARNRQIDPPPVQPRIAATDAAAAQGPVDARFAGLRGDVTEQRCAHGIACTRMRLRHHHTHRAGEPVRQPPLAIGRKGQRAKIAVDPPARIRQHQQPFGQAQRFTRRRGVKHAVERTQMHLPIDHPAVQAWLDQRKAIDLWPAQPIAQHHLDTVDGQIGMHRITDHHRTQHFAPQPDRYDAILHRQLQAGQFAVDQVGGDAFTRAPYPAQHQRHRARTNQRDAPHTATAMRIAIIIRQIGIVRHRPPSCADARLGQSP